MTVEQSQDAKYLAQVLRAMAENERIQYKARVLYDTAKLLSDLYQGDDKSDIAVED